MSERPVKIYVDIISYTLQANYKYVDYDRLVSYLQKIANIHPTLKGLEIKKGFVVTSTMPDTVDSYRALSILLNYIYTEMSNAIGQEEAKRRIIKIAFRQMKRDEKGLQKIGFEHFVPAFMKNDVRAFLSPSTDADKISELKRKLTAIPTSTTPEAVSRMAKVKAPVYEAKISARDHVYLVSEHEEPLFVSKISDLKRKLMELEVSAPHPSPGPSTPPARAAETNVPIKEEMERGPERAEKVVKKPAPTVKVPVRKGTVPDTEVTGMPKSDVMGYKPHPGRMTVPRGQDEPYRYRTHMGEYRPPKWFGPLVLVVVILFAGLIYYALSAIPTPTGATMAFHTPKVIPSATMTRGNYVTLSVECGAKATITVFSEHYAGGMWDRFKQNTTETNDNGLVYINVPLSSGLNRLSVEAEDREGKTLFSTPVDVVKIGAHTVPIGITASAPDGGTMDVYIDRVYVNAITLTSEPKVHRFSWPMGAGEHKVHLYWRGEGSARVINFETYTGVMFVGAEREGILIPGENIEAVFQHEGEGSGDIVPEDGKVPSAHGLVFDLSIDDEEREVHTLTLIGGSLSPGTALVVEIWVDNAYVYTMNIGNNGTYTVPVPLLLAPGSHEVVVLVNTGLITQTPEAGSVIIWSVGIETQILSPTDMTFDRGSGLEAVDGQDTVPGDAVLEGQGALKGTIYL